MNLDDLLGDRAAAVLYAAIDADNPNTIRDAESIGGTLGSLMLAQVSLRVGGVLVAVLPDLLADAWDDGHNAGSQDARAVNPDWPDATPNPYRKTDR